jgi:hypothetical protein
MVGKARLAQTEKGSFPKAAAVERTSVGSVQSSGAVAVAKPTPGLRERSTAARDDRE